MGAVILKLRSDKFLKLKSFLFFSFFSKIFLFSSILKMNSSFRLLMVAIVATALLQTFVAGGGPGLRQDERVLFVKRNGKKCLGTVQTCCHQEMVKLADLLPEYRCPKGSKNGN